MGLARVCVAAIPKCQGLEEDTNQCPGGISSPHQDSLWVVLEPDPSVPVADTWGIQQAPYSLPSAFSNNSNTPQLCDALVF